MADIIQLLPDNIANQIAAGEVIQRPASAVKELLENAIDAGATEIKLNVTDSGKSLIQVIDNGKGMSPLDARMCFERHATSKIKEIDDLFQIKTMGFRGEALASIAAVSQVEIKTRRKEDEMGVLLEIENSRVIRQEPVATAGGTCISMKNLFFNIPARRNFLKTNASELKHIHDEFLRVAMAFPQLFFSFTSNGQQVYHLEKGSHKQRIIQLLGNHLNAKLVSVNEQTDYLNITGFAGKPETARKTRGDQYFFVNNRFIRSPYLNHAVMSAYQDLISPDSYPLYALYIEIDPAHIDVNVHPTKQEIKFEDEKLVYAFVQAAVKHALAQFSITPTLDFDLDPGIQQLEAISQPVTDFKRERVTGSNIFQSFTGKHQAHLVKSNGNGSLYNPFSAESVSSGTDYFSEIPKPASFKEFKEETGNQLIQLLNTYIVTASSKGIMLIHQQLAHERILYERYQDAFINRPVAIQQSLFPVTIHLNPADSLLLNEILPELLLLGYDIRNFGKDSFVIQGTPADTGSGNEQEMAERILEQYKNFSNLSIGKREKLIRSLAGQHAIKAGNPLSEPELKSLVADLFACTTPNVTPGGQPTYISFKEGYLSQLFQK